MQTFWGEWGWMNCAGGQYRRQCNALHRSRRRCTYLLDWICDGWPVVPAQAAEDHGAEGGPDGEPATRPHQRQRRAVRGPPVQTVKFAT